MTYEVLKSDISAFMNQVAEGTTDTTRRDALLEQALTWQYNHVKPYQKFVDAHRATSTRTSIEWPALPTDVFRYARIAAHAPEEDICTFVTSGTTLREQGKHFLKDLSLYDQSSFLTARYAMFPDCHKLPLYILAPSKLESPTSSLTYMLSRFMDWFAEEGSAYIWHNNRLDIPLLHDVLTENCQHHQPVALFGTSLAFAHALESLSTQWELPYGSRVMLTGGSKGSTRDVLSDTFRAKISHTFGVPDNWIVNEYGMTELCSQLYDLNLRHAIRGESYASRSLWSPGWVRITVIDPRNGQPCREGDAGIIRIDDLANLDTVCAIQTSDLGIQTPDGLLLLGRTQKATARGCSLEADARLSAQGPLHANVS